jgi:hypothetical protein
MLHPSALAALLLLLLLPLVVLLLLLPARRLQGCWCWWCSLVL